MGDLSSTDDEKPMPWVRGFFPQAIGNALPAEAKQTGDLSGFIPERPPKRLCVVQKTVDTDALGHPIQLVDVRSWP